MLFLVSFISRSSPARRSVKGFDCPLACNLNESIFFNVRRDQVPRTFYRAYQQIHTNIRKACAFSASFDLLKVLDLPFDVQIYAWKTHAENVSVHKTMLEHHLILFKTCLGFPTNQDLAFYAIIYVCCLSVVLCHRQIFVCASISQLQGLLTRSNRLSFIIFATFGCKGTQKK